MIATVEETSAQSIVVKENSALAASNVSGVAAAIEEMVASVNEISHSILDASSLVDGTATRAQESGTVMTELETASDRVYSTVEVINGLADQTNLLALNAAIESARAGEAGRGFAVVADEVKKLAEQTGKATGAIESEIHAIQKAVEMTVKTLGDITQSVVDVRDHMTTISAASEEQGSTAQEIGNNMSDTASRVAEVDQNITGVEQATQDAGVAANQVFESSEQVKVVTDKVADAVNRFKVYVSHL